MGSITPPDGELFEFEWVNLDYPNVDMGITSVAFRYSWYEDTTQMFLQADLASGSAVDHTFPGVAQDANHLIWRHSITLNAFLQGKKNVRISATPQNSTDVGEQAVDLHVGILLSQSEYNGLTPLIGTNTGTTATAPLVESGAPLADHVWEEARRDRRATDDESASRSLAALAASATEASGRSITVPWARGTVKEGNRLTLDEPQAGLVGTFIVTRVQDAPGGGLTITLGDVKPNVGTVDADAATRLATVERGS